MKNTDEIVYCIRVALNVDKDVDVAKVKLELEELERLAEIGRATEKAHKYNYRLTKNPYSTISKKFFSIEELLEWAKED